MHNDIVMQCNIDEPKVNEPLNIIKVKDKEFNSNSKDLSSKILENTNTHSSGRNNSNFAKNNKVNFIQYLFIL